MPFLLVPTQAVWDALRPQTCSLGAALAVRCHRNHEAHTSRRQRAQKLVEEPFRPPLAGLGSENSKHA